MARDVARTKEKSHSRNNFILCPLVCLCVLGFELQPQDKENNQLPFTTTATTTTTINTNTTVATETISFAITKSTT